MRVRCRLGDIIFNVGYPEAYRCASPLSSTMRARMMMYSYTACGLNPRSTHSFPSDNQHSGPQEMMLQILSLCRVPYSWWTANAGSNSGPRDWRSSTATSSAVCCWCPSRPGDKGWTLRRRATWCSWSYQRARRGFDRLRTGCTADDRSVEHI